MSTDADIDALIERLDSHMGQQAATVLLADCRLARDALKQLRAERDAAARDMRERCAEDLQRLRTRHYDIGTVNAAIARIRALPDTPAVMATEGDNG